MVGIVFIAVSIAGTALGLTGDAVCSGQAWSRLSSPWSCSVH
jgi:hypothetical protein